MIPIIDLCLITLKNNREQIFRPETIDLKLKQIDLSSPQTSLDVFILFLKLKVHTSLQIYSHR